MTARRQRLPDRRAHELITFELGGVRYHAGVGHFADGRPAEIFLTGKTGTHADTAARDAAIACSIALQYGAPVETIRKALCRNVDGTAGGPLGRVLDLLAEGGQP